MSYVIAWVSKDQPNHYLKVVDKFYSFKDPAFATTFFTPADAENLLATHNGVEANFKILPLKEALDTYAKLIASGQPGPSIAFLSPVSRRYSKETPDEVLDWRINYYINPQGTIKSADYATWPDLHRIFSCLFEVQQYATRDSKLRFIAVSMRVPYNISFRIFKHELNKVLPRTTLLDKDGNKLVPIFHTKGKFAHHQLKCGDGKFAVLDTYFENPDVLCSGSLETCFEYIKTNYAYPSDPATPDNE